MNAVLSIDDIPQTELVGRRVLVRIEAEDDVPRPDPLSTVAFLSKSGARVVIATDKQLDDQRSLLTHLSGREVCKLGEWKGETGQRAVAHLPEGGIALIENLALDPGEQTADDSFAKQLAQLCDIYCNDAFSISHEIRASTVTVAKHTKLAVAGSAFAAEFSLLELMRGGTAVPTLAVLGGQASKENLQLGAEIARRSDHTLVAGGLPIPFLVAKGVLPSAAGISDEMVAIAEQMTKEAQSDKRFISTPTDFAVMDSTAFQRLTRGDRQLIADGKPATEILRCADEIAADLIVMGSRDGSILGRMGVSVSHRVSNRAKVVSPEMKDGQDPPITTEVTTGSASDEILHLARERKVDLIAIGTKGLTLLDEGVFGGTAKRVFSAAPSSVLAVRER